MNIDFEEFKIKMENSVSNVRDLKFDIVKAIAIYLVVYGHLLDNFTSTQTYLITFCHMQIFFFVSGYFYNKSIHKYSYKQIVFKKLIGLLVPYLMWSTISYFANITLSLLKNGKDIEIYKIIVNEFIEIFIFSRSVWYLIELFFVMMIFLLFYIISNKLHWNLLLVSLVGWLTISLIIPSNIFAFYKFKWLFPFFLLGYYTNNMKEKLTLFNVLKMQNKILLICGSVYLILGTIFYNKQYFKMYIMFEYIDIPSIFVGGLYYLISICSIFFMFSLANKVKNQKIGKRLSEIGHYTIDIYVLHMFLIKFVIWIPREMTNTMLSFIWLPLYTLIIVVSIFIFSKYIFRKFSIYRLSIGER